MMTVLVDIMFLVYSFGLVLFCGFFPRVPTMAKNAVLTMLGHDLCEHEEKPKSRFRDND